ncbi:hypothetical protein EYF80_003154 [Liparis tanakae]|uniref:Uncharacterized protein n=1 Tax=Liparis tanakae TaxID=230148 RepID=A0A4Z2J8Z0_9TELE|nr:hypothetical protein EYF80_003154 [Liparis tanakae]
MLQSGTTTPAAEQTLLLGVKSVGIEQRSSAPPFIRMASWQKQCERRGGWQLSVGAQRTLTTRESGLFHDTTPISPESSTWERRPKQMLSERKELLLNCESVQVVETCATAPSGTPPLEYALGPTDKEETPDLPVDLELLLTTLTDRRGRLASACSRCSNNSSSFIPLTSVFR